MASLNFETEKSSFREYFNENVDNFRTAESLFCSLITAMLASEPGIERPTVTSRVKNREECIRKFSIKYQENLEQKQVEYEIKDYVTDIIGVRVVCLYGKEIKLVADTLRANFEIVSETDKSGTLENTDDCFGYKGYHLDLKLSSERSRFPEYARFADFQFEVQIRTISQDAWSTIDHKIMYKKSIPIHLRRRLTILAALFELADREFQDIHEESSRLLKEATDLQQKEKNPSSQDVSHATPLDAFSFIAVARMKFTNYTFINFNADSFVQELLRLSSSITVELFRDILDEHLPRVQEYHASAPYRLNPYTQIRHALYLSDKCTYRAALFDIQRNSFETWLLKSGDSILISPPHTAVPAPPNPDERPPAGFP